MRIQQMPHQSLFAGNTIKMAACRRKIGAARSQGLEIEIDSICSRFLYEAGKNP